MKITRLLQLTSYLLNKKTATAAELARRFEVSTRTIYRDIDILSAAGVPVYCSQGAGGGISILENYTVNRASLSNSEQDSVMLALQTLQATKYPAVDAVLEKLGGLFQNTASDWISIDFSPWGSNPNANNKFSDIKSAILQSRVISFDYINTWNEKSRRQAEPIRLVFKAQAWYLWAYCQRRCACRLFRVSRMKNVTLAGDHFDRAALLVSQEQTQDCEADRRKMVHLVLEFSAEVYYRLCDDYNESDLVFQPNGNHQVSLDIPEDEWVYSYILSFGTQVTVIEPQHIQQLIKKRAAAISAKYLNL